MGGMLRRQGNTIITDENSEHRWNNQIRKQV